MPRRRRKKGRKGRTCLEVKSPFCQTVFYERDRRWHEDKHPELKSQEFLSQVKEIIKRPWRVYRRPMDSKNTFVFYGRVGKIETPLTPLFKFRYTKVVVAVDRYQVNRIRTAYGVNNIKERMEISVKKRCR